MSISSQDLKSRLTLKELAHVNDVLIPLASGGQPLEQGIAAYLPNTSGRVHRVLSQLHDQLSAGTPLGVAVENMSDDFSSVYCHVVQAGIDSGKLGAVLKSFSDYIWQLIDIRQQISRILVYPILVFSTAYVLFFFVINIVVDRFIVFYNDMRIPTQEILIFFRSLADTGLYWFWVPPALLAMAIYHWISLNDSRILSMNHWSHPLKWVPGLQQTLKNFRLAHFSQLLSTMLAQQIPFSQAFQLSLNATGDTQLSTILQGDPLQPGLKTSEDNLSEKLSPYLAWVIESASLSSSIEQTLNNASHMYYRRAERSLSWFRLLAPIVTLICIGGLATLAYALAVFVPLTNMFGDLAVLSTDRLGGFS